MNPLESRQMVSQYLNTILYGNLEVIPPDKSVQDKQILVSKELENLKQDDVIECKKSRVQLNAIGLFCKTIIIKGAKIGPYSGQLYSIGEDYKGIDGERIEIYEVGEDKKPEGISKFLVSSTGIENWMQFVRYARNKKEQNLIIVQEKSQLFFIAIRDIHSNEELLIWYGDFYNLKCGIPSVETLAQVNSECATPTPGADGSGAFPSHEKGLSYPHSQHHERSRDLLHGLFLPSEDGPKQKVWKCVRCTKTFISTGSLRAHARIHTGEKPYTCSFCQRSFCQMSTLRSHIRLHTGEKPFKCGICHRSFTQSAGLRSHKKTHKVSPVYLTPNRRSPNGK